MKLTIKEIKEKCEKDDKVSFKGEVKAVYAGVEAITKYSVLRQNVIIKDETDEIKVIISHKAKEDEYTKEIIGKQIEIVNGKVSEYNNQKNIFVSKLTFKEGEAPQQKDTSTTIRPATTSILPAGAEIRKVSLMGAIQFWGSHIGFAGNEEEIIVTAKKFETYIRGSIAKTKTEIKPKPEDKPIEKKELPKDESRQVIVLEQEKIKLINEIMELKETQNIDAESFASYCDDKDIKTLSIEALRELKKRLESFTDDIPF
jgi:hypothetical protein